MKHLKLILTAGALSVGLLTFESWSAPVTPEAALNKAAGFRSSGFAGGKMAAPKDAKFEVAYTVEKNGRNCFYVINNNGGFTIISADDRLPEVLGFSDNGNFDVNNIPENMKWWLSQYENEIDAYLTADPIAQPATDKRISFIERKTIAPMVKTQWNQDDPYNLLCPYDNRYGGISVTGCVATAMAQVMKYHEWPKKPSGSIGDYEFNEPYQWDKMLNRYDRMKYDNDQADAVALLMRDCGASVKMQYSAYESGAYNEQVQVALREYFDYNPSMEFAWRNYHDMNEWNDLVYKELEQKRPVYYSGRSTRGGHAFVCDGYLSANFFHFNWGWGGYQDGYFLLNALNPSSGGAGSYEGGYNIDQCILLGVKPSNGETEIQMTLNALGDFRYDETDGRFICTNDPDGYNMFYNPLFYTVTGTTGLKVTSEADPTNVKYIRSSQRVNLESLYGIQSINCTISGLEDGTYRVTPAFLTDYGKWNDIGVSRNMQYYVTLKVEGGKYTYSNEGLPEPKLVCGLPQSSAKIYGDAVQAFTVMVSNISEADFNGVLTLVYNDAANAFGNAVSIDKTVTIAGRSSLNVEFVSNIPIGKATYSGYIMANNSEDNILLSFTFDADNYGFQHPDKENDIQISSVAPNFYNSKEKKTAVSFEIRNKSMLDVNQKMIIRLFEQDQAKPVLQFTTDEYIVPGRFNGTLRFPDVEVDLVPGVYYWQVFSHANTPLSNPYTMIVTEGPIYSNGGYYYITSEKDKTATFSNPMYHEYTSGIYIPSSYDGYTITALRGDTFTFADQVTDVHIPATITSIEPGTFYCASGLKYVKFYSPVPPVLYENAFDPELQPEVVLNCPHGYANIYARETAYTNFNLSSWEITIDDDDLTLLTSLELDPLTNKVYSPYYVSGDEEKVLTFEAPQTRAIQFELEFGDTKETRYTWRDVVLPALWGGSGKVKISTVDGAGINPEIVEEEGADVYSVDGYVVKRNAKNDDMRNLPAGIYIHRGKKVVVK